MLVLLASCSPKKFLTEGEYLQNENKVDVNYEENKVYKPLSETELRSILRPKVNEKLFGAHVPAYLWLKATADRDTTSFDRFLMRSFANEPIFYDSLRVEKTNEGLKTYLFNHGFFHPEVSSSTKKDDFYSKTTYQLKPGRQYIYGNIKYENKDSIENFSDLVNEIDIHKYIKKGEAYNVEDFTNLQNAIVKKAQNNGYYRFNRGSIFMEADTIGKRDIVDIYAIIEKQNDSLFNKKFYFRNTYVKVGKGTGEKYKEAIEYNGKLFSNSESVTVRPSVLDRFIFIEKGKPYSKEKHVKTINKFYDLPIVKYANIEFKELEINDSLFLDTYITAVTNQPEKIRFAPSIVEFDGPGLSAPLSYEHRNIFGGGENFSIDLDGGLESALTTGNKIFSTSYWSVGSSLQLPRLLIFENIYPDTYKNTTNQQTKITAKIGKQNRQNQFKFTETSLRVNWDWQSNERNRHSLSLIDISYIDSALKPEFRDWLQNFPTSLYNYQDRFLIGSKYTYTYSTLNKKKRKSYYDFTGTLESTGNLAYALFGQKKDTLKLGNVPVARYVKTNLEYKYNFMFGQNSSLVNRIYLGMAYPIGSVKSIPAVSQFYTGGYGIRAWRDRKLGPGAFNYNTLGNVDPRTLDLRGDIKLEYNLEYRYPVTKLFGQQLEGALFTDAGNIWSLYEFDKQGRGRVGAEFSDSFYKEIAIGSGAGLRLKIQNFFMIRADLAYKVRNPALPLGNRWVSNPLKGKENRIIAVGINYPF